MIITFKEIEIHNFLSIGDAKLKLDNNGYVLVSGVNLNKSDNAKSNGSGKSTIFEAIVYALTGETVRGVKDIVNINSNDGAFVDLIFKIDKDEYRLLRSKNHKEYGTNLKIWKNGENLSGKGIRDSEKLLAQYLPDLSSMLIGSVIVLGQGLPQRFTNNTPSGRKEVLEKLSKSDFMIEDLKNKITSRKTVLQEQLDTLNTNIVKKNTQSDMLAESVQNAQTELDSIESFDESILNELCQVINNQSKEGQQIEDSIKALNDSVQQYRNQYILVKEKSAVEESNINKQYENAILEATSNSIKLGEVFRQLDSEIETAKNIKDVCPTCGQRLLNVVKPDITPLMEKRESIFKEFEKERFSADSLKAERCEKVDSVKKKYDNELKTIQSTAEEIKRNINEKSAQLSEIKTKLEQNNTELNRLQILRNSIEQKQAALTTSIVCNNERLNSIKEEIAKASAQKEALLQHLEVVTKFDTIIKRDFRGFLLKNVIDYIDSKVKEYANDVFEIGNIDFILDGNNININYGQRQYESLSGGEKQKVDMIVQFAIRDMLCNFLNFSCNILVIDECFDNLDSIGCQQALNLISKKLNDVESIYIITHRDELEIPYDKIIKVIKNTEGVSSVR